MFQDCHFFKQAEVAVFIIRSISFACFDDAPIYFWFIDLVVGKFIQFIGPNIARKCGSVLLALFAKGLGV